MFDPEALAARALVTGRSGAGRAGGAVFFELEGVALVLRRYRRGGLARRLTADRYVSRGAARSRPMRELALLLELEALGLPAPRAFAARRTRHGPFESGALVTYRLPGTTLAERLVAAGRIGSRAAVPWTAIGRCVARFHRAGVLHADLNAHNVMLAPPDESVAPVPDVFLIDFDRGRRLRGPVPRARARAQLRRLGRSLDKVAALAGRESDPDGLDALRDAWERVLSVR